MKPAPFAYLRAESVPAATAALARFGDEGKILAGGQSLLPLMNFRLARPEALIDIGALRELSGVRAGDGRVSVGALTRHLDLERCALTGPLGTLLRASAAHVGHLPIRTRGTFGGSVAHADPAAEWCMLTTLLDGSVTAVSASGERQIAAPDFFETVFTTALEPDELLIAVTLPALGDHHRVAVAEFARRAGDFAVVAVMVAYPYGLHVAVVRVDRGTGQVTAERLLAAYDIGRAVNPMMVEGQIVGGAAQGLGGALLEEFRYDADGQPQCTTFMDYLMPTRAEMPPVDVLVTTDAPSPRNPLGVKGAGEGGTTAMGAAVAAAVDAAVGIPGGVRDLPVRAEAVLALLRAAGHGSTRPSGGI